MSREKILIIEDEYSIQTIVRTYLENAGYRVFCTDNGRDGLDLYHIHHPALIILDLNLPEMDGLQIAARLRQESDVYILMLTARSEEDDRIAGLKIGADDYLTKPFSPRELVARVEAVLRRRRTGPRQNNLLHFSHLTIDVDGYEAQVGENALELTPTEFKLLLAFARHPGRVLSREQLLRRVWGENFYGNDRVVDVYVGQLRRKVLDIINVELFETIRGVGYKFTDEPVDSTGRS